MTVAAVGFGEAVGNTNVREELLNIASNEDLAFEFGTGTEVRYGCAATLMNEFWYFGGTSFKRQVRFSK